MRTKRHAFAKVFTESLRIFFAMTWGHLCNSFSFVVFLSRKSKRNSSRARHNHIEAFHIFKFNTNRTYCLQISRQYTNAETNRDKFCTQKWDFETILYYNLGLGINPMFHSDLHNRTSSPAFDGLWVVLLGQNGQKIGQNIKKCVPVSSCIQIYQVIYNSINKSVSGCQYRRKKHLSGMEVWFP